MNRNTFLLLITLIFVYACSEKQKVAKPIIKDSNSLIIGNPFDYGVNSMLLFPVGSNYQPIVYEPSSTNDELKQITDAKIVLGFCANTSTYYDKSAEKEFKNNDEDKFDIRNILFYDLKTEKSYLLTSDTFHILSFAIHKEFTTPLIFYRVVKKDNNNDSIYNFKDPVILFISDMMGRNLTQITPSDEQFTDYSYYSQTNIILIKTSIDSDADKQFTNYDETNFRELKMDNPTMGKEIFSKSLKDTLRLQLKVR